MPASYTADAIGAAWAAARVRWDEAYIRSAHVSMTPPIAAALDAALPSLRDSLLSALPPSSSAEEIEAVWPGVVGDWVPAALHNTIISRSTDAYNEITRNTVPSLLPALLTTLAASAPP